MDNHIKGIFPKKLENFFSIFEKEQGRPPLPSLSSYAPVIACSIDLSSDINLSFSIIFISLEHIPIFSRNLYFHSKVPYLISQSSFVYFF